MGTATSVSIELNQRMQFRGVFENVWCVHFTVDVGSVATNGVDSTTVSVPGLDKDKDIVLGWTHVHATGAHAHELIESIHTWDDELHLVVHNATGGPIDPPSTEYKVVIGRLTHELYA